jgi:hypothetical protein
MEQQQPAGTIAADGSLVIANETSIYDRTCIAANAFPGVGTIHLPGRPAIPGDYGVAKAGNIDGFTSGSSCR